MISSYILLISAECEKAESPDSDTKKASQREKKDRAKSKWSKQLPLFMVNIDKYLHTFTGKWMTREISVSLNYVFDMQMHIRHTKYVSYD